MLKKANIVLFLICMGLFLVPSRVHACPSVIVAKSNTSCCGTAGTHHKVEKSCKMKCCDSKNSKPTKCPGKCGTKTCQNSPTGPNFVVSSSKSFFDSFFVSIEKQYSLYQQPHYSEGTHSIWQPPKIA